MPRPHALLALLALPLAAATECGPRLEQTCAGEGLRHVDAEVAGPTFELRVDDDHAELPVRVEVSVSADEPLLVLHSPPGAPVPARSTLLRAAVGVPLADGSVVLARDTRRVELQLSGADVAGHVRFVRLGPRAKPLHVVGTVALVHAEAPRGDCGPGPAVHIEQPATCGNGLVEVGEACDDENATDADGCTACRKDAATCVPGEAGAVAFWDCPGEPSDCGLRRCAAGVDCPPGVGGHVLGAGLRLRGASDATTRVRLSSDAGGLDCACRGAMPDPVCEGACRVELPACTPVTLSASPPAAAWTGACAGQGSACTLVAPPGFGELTAVVDLGADRVGGAFLVGAGAPWNDRTMPIPIAVSAGGDVAVSALFREDAGLPGVRADDLRTRRFIAVLGQGGALRRARHLGLADEIVVQALAFDGDDLLLAGASGNLRAHAAPTTPQPEEYPTTFVERQGARAWRRPLDVLWGPHASVVALPDGGVAATFAAARPIAGGWGGLTAALVRLDADGRERWRWATDRDRAWLALQTVTVATNGRLLAAGMLGGGVDAPAEPLPGLGTDAQARGAFSVAFDDGGEPTGAGVYTLEDSVRGHVRVTPGGAVTALAWASRRDLRVFRTPDAGHASWSAIAAPASDCHDGRFESIPHLAVYPATDAVAVASPLCGPDGLAIHVFDGDGGWRRSFRFDVAEGGMLHFGGLAFGPDGDLRLAAQLHGAAVFGDARLESEGWTPTVVTLAAR